MNKTPLLNKTPLFTIGYSGFTPEQFVETLKQAGVEVLVDVRERALSRKKGFSKNALREYLEAGGIEYRHLQVLGVPGELRQKLREGLCITLYLDAFRQYLDTCDENLDDLYELATTRRCCLMCVEADVEECHRSVVADALFLRNGHRLKVQHL